jgi:hypothetical protein
MADAADPCESCGHLFPGREGTGDCQKCLKLAVHEVDSKEYTDIQVSVNALDLHAIVALTFLSLLIRSTLNACIADLRCETYLHRSLWVHYNTALCAF